MALLLLPKQLLWLTVS